MNFFHFERHPVFYFLPVGLLGFWRHDFEFFQISKFDNPISGLKNWIFDSFMDNGSAYCDCVNITPVF